MINLDPTRRDEATEAGYQACREELSKFDKEDYRQLMGEWNPVAVCDDEKVIGVLISKNGFVHLAIVPEYRGRWASRRIIREMLRYGTTTDPGDNDEFVERLGFVRSGNLYKHSGAICRS
jgi:GNAT superfamily N-acetyltransferase